MNISEKKKKAEEFRLAVFARDRKKIEQLLEEGVSIYTKFGDGNSALHVMVGNYDMVKFFLDKGINPNVQNSVGETPLHHASREEHIDLEVIRLLLETGANPNITNEFGDTPLHYAIHGGVRIDVIRELLKHGGNPRIVGSRKEDGLEMAKRVDDYGDIVELVERYM